MYNTDPRDHARTATATASSEWANATAANVLTGQTRAIATGNVGISIGAGGGVGGGAGVTVWVVVRVWRCGVVVW